LTYGNQARAIPFEGADIFPAMADRIAEARQTVDLQVFLWESGSDPALAILDGLRRLAENRPSQGPAVIVRILVNHHYLINPAGKQGLDRDVAALRLDPWRVRVQTATHSHGGLGFHHSKILVVDGRHAMVTGANVQHQYDFNRTWYDRAFLLEGPIARELRGDFDDAWRESLRLPPSPRRNGPPTGTAGAAMRIVGRPAQGWLFLPSSTTSQEQAFLAAIDNAQRRIWIQTPNLNERRIVASLVRAVRRRVRVRLILSKGFNRFAEGLPGQNGCNEDTVHRIAQELRRSGLSAVEIPRWLDVRWYSHDGRLPIEGGGAHASHAKYASFDGQIAIVGSTNLDTLSFLHSRETNVVVEDPATAQAWDRQFDTVFERSIPVQLQ
jgi:phosphatidylserine/phosphatidylglycerophosphate/cardiolipin synthase-like enzyme